MKKYAMLQIDADVHQLLKSFCKEKVTPNQTLPTNVLRSK
jgi:hypothetical protein